MNPIGHICYESEQEILKVIDSVASNIDFHVIAVHNQQTVEKYMQQLGMDKIELKERNQLFQTMYKASLAFKAASLQGKKKGRYYLMRMQEQLRANIDKFDHEFTLDLAREVGLDLEIFEDDMESEFVKQLYFKDQRIAVDMNVHEVPSLVIFEYNSGDGRLISNKPITYEMVLEELDQITSQCVEELSKKKKLTNPFRILN